MTIIARSIPEAARPYSANPFKIFIPRQLTEDQAREVWAHLRENQSIVLADPFALEGVSTVFPGIMYDVVSDFHLTQVVNTLNGLIATSETAAEALADAWVELWVPESLEDEAEALDVTDLTGRG